MYSAQDTFGRHCKSVRRKKNKEWPFCADVTAIDFGTTYSGYAFSMRHEFKTDPLKIHANQAWNSGGRALLSLKTPTCLLLNDKKELDSFGYEAENKYADIVMDDEQDNYYYFHRFKMNLHNNKKITSHMVLEDIRGKSVPAIEVFGLSIKALVTHLTDILDKQGTGMDKSEIQWVLTVPAIWTDAAKQFMRKSAVKAGIPEDSLKIALEPEAASIFCQYLPTKKLHGADEGFTMTEPGAKYMVVDLGGGTADITVHEKLSNGQLKELCRAAGNDCGGTSVDGRFFQMLVKIFGGPLMKKIKDDDPSAYLDLFREFETVKRTITPEKDSKVNITIPYASLDTHCNNILGENLADVLGSSPYSKQIAVRGDKMRVDADVMKALFKPTIDNIISLMKEILQNKAASDVSQLLLVGGFSECILIQDAVKRNFKSKKVIIPEEAGLSVLKGAVLFGHRPEYVRSRVMRFSYAFNLGSWIAENRPHLKRSRVVRYNNGLYSCIVKYEFLDNENKHAQVLFSLTKRTSGVSNFKPVLSFRFFLVYKRNRAEDVEPGCSNIPGDNCHASYFEEKAYFSCGLAEGRLQIYHKDIKITLPAHVEAMKGNGINVSEVWSSGISCKKEKKAKKCSQRVADDF
ncbi:Hypothetical predicted protein [Mytilus galloprovincialis]|uniref:Heat shock 70 kDa protein 12A n=1 Tax=Mytilus galloprovincialis TaxID=29158 RepID=A0A8B6FMN8_MYTGA|nr:Hypothetical predicted protein [Mytilus galloprovincialis]